MLRAGTLVESDTFWQARTGLTILRTGALPATDPYSWWAAGRPWTLNSWGFDVLLGLADRLGGLTMVALVGAAGVLAVGAAVLWLARLLGATAGVATVVTVVGLAILTAWLSDRPQLVDYVAVPLLLVFFEAGVRAEAGWRLAWIVGSIAAIEVAWVNLHAAAVIGVVVLAAASLGVPFLDLGEKSVSWRGLLPKIRRPAAMVLAAALGCLVNPYGVGVVGQSLRVRAASAQITEWYHLDVTAPLQVVALLLVLAAALVAWLRHRYDLVAALVVLAIGAVAALRILPIAALVALPVLAARASGSAWLERRRDLLRATLIGLVGAFAVVAAPGLSHLGRPGHPVAAIKALPPGCRLFNSYPLGGPVIYFRPDVLVSLDSRSDLYGVADVRDQSELEAGPPDASAQLDALKVTCVLVEPRAGLVARLRADGHWRELATTATGIAFARR